MNSNQTFAWKVIVDLAGPERAKLQKVSTSKKGSSYKFYTTVLTLGF
jgi:hypothetical protein